VEKGALEAAVNKENSLYENNHTINETEKYLIINNFEISKIENVDKNIDKEKNIYFNKKNLYKNYKINTKYNIRYYKRIVSNKLNFKDKFFDKLKKIIFY